MSEIKKPKNRTFAIARSADGSVLHRVTIAPNQVMTTGQPVVESTEREAEYLNLIAPYVSRLPTLPDEGEQVEKGEIYSHKGGAVMARQSHRRTSHAPKDVPALFTTYQGTADGLAWIAGEKVDLGTLREYEGKTYRVKQAHTTQSDWTPTLYPAGWDLVAKPEPEPEPDKTPEFRAGIDVVVGDVYTYEGDVYRVRQNHTTAAHWPPPVVPALWTPLINVNLASLLQLQTLAGVGPTLAQAIIDGRPYAEVDDLTRVSGVTQSMVDRWEVAV